MITPMFTINQQKPYLRKINRARIDPLVDQVKKILSNRDQNLILMVKG
jgi:hypothetical protein